jgi:hypothetical protein
MHHDSNRPKPREMALLLGLPQGFLNDLPEDDQAAIREMVGKPILLCGYGQDGRAELEFTSAEGTTHTIYLDPGFIESVQ